MKQTGVSFLEVVVVVAILMIVSSFLAPSITDWRQKRALESDFAALLSQMDYLKTRTRTVNGTSLIVCPSTNGSSSVLTYQVSSNAQNSTSLVSTNFAPNVIEDPVATNAQFNILSGKTKVVSSLCNGLRGILIATGQSGLEGGNGAIDVVVQNASSQSAISGYRILLNQSTGFIQKYKANSTGDNWVELD